MLKLPLDRHTPRWITVGLGMACASLIGSAPAWGEGALYRWVTEDGVVAYTDDARRIPDRYRDTAKLQPLLGLSSYARYTPADSEATTSYASRLNERLVRLRTLNRESELAERQVAAAPDGGASVAIRTGGEEGQPSIELSVPEEAEKPVVVEVERVVDENNAATRHITVVRQGDRVLSIIDPRKSWSPSSGTLQDRLDGRL